MLVALAAVALLCLLPVPNLTAKSARANGLRLLALVQPGQGPILPGILYGNSSSGGGVVSHSHLQDCTGNTNSTTAVTCVFGSNLGASHLLYVCVEDAGTDRGYPAATGDGSGGSIQQDQGYSFGAQQLYCWFKLSTTGGGTTLTFTEPGGTNYGFARTFGSEFSNASSGLDQSDAPGFNGSSGTSVTSHSITTTNPGELVIGSGIWFGNGATITAGGSFTLGPISPASVAALEYQTQGSAGSINAAFTIGSSLAWGAHVASFK